MKVVHIFLDGRRISSDGGVLLRRGDADSYDIITVQFIVHMFPQLQLLATPTMTLLSSSPSQLYCILTAAL